MRKRIIQYNKWFFKLAIPAFLFVWVIFLALQLNPEVPLSIILQNFSAKNYTQWTTKELLAHHFVEGKFTAGQDNLGIVAVRFNTYIRINSDSVIFRIRDANSSSWFYTGSYKVDQFQPNQEFTFGFPIIYDSKGKTYVFQVESVKGIHKDAIALSPIEPVFSAKYQFTKAYFSQNPLSLAKFIVDKLISVYTDFSTSFYFLAYLYLGLIGFVGYYLWLFLGIKFSYARILIGIYVVFIAIDILVPTLPFRGISLLLLSITWVAICIYYSFSSDVSFYFSLFCFCLCVVIKLIGFEIAAEYISHWMYLFFIVGVLQLIAEQFFPKKRTLTASQLLQQEFIDPLNQMLSKKHDKK